MSTPTLAVWKFASCDGCQLTLLDCEDELLTIAGQVTIALTCGPEVMMRFLVESLSDEGLPADRVYVSLERNMQCGIGHCGHCQLGPMLICRDGAVVRFDRVADWLAVREL